MLGPYIQKSLSSPVAKLYSSLLAKTGNAAKLSMLLTAAIWITGLAAMVSFGLQYFTPAIILFLLHRLTIAIRQSDKQLQADGNQEILRDYFVITGSLIAMLWTAGDSAMAVAFLFWALMINILGKLSLKPDMVLIDLFEVSLLLIVTAFAPDYIPAIAILFGVACLVSLGASYLQYITKKA